MNENRNNSDVKLETEYQYKLIEWKTLKGNSVWNNPLPNIKKKFQKNQWEEYTYWLERTGEIPIYAKQ